MIGGFTTFDAPGVRGAVMNSNCGRPGGGAGNFSRPEALHVMHIITRFIRGGADENTLLTCNGQVELGHRVTLIVGCESDAAMVAQLRPEVQLIVAPDLVREVSLKRDAKALCSLMKVIGALRPDIVHTHESKAGILGRITAFFRRVPVIVHGVHILAFENAHGLTRKIYLAAERIVANVTHAFIHVSPQLLDACRSAGIGSRAHHAVVRSGMDVARYHRPTPHDWRRDDRFRSLEANPDKFVLISGTLEPRKRVAEFLEVFASVCTRVPNICLLVAGDGQEMGNIKRRVAELGLQGRVVLLGYVADLAPYIGLADVCVHAAEHEGLARVLVQYAIGGKPTVSTDLPGVSEILPPGSAIVPTDELSAMVEPICCALTTPPREEARSIEFGEWAQERMVSAIELIYQREARLIARRRKAA